MIKSSSNKAKYDISLQLFEKGRSYWHGFYRWRSQWLLWRQLRWKLLEWICGGHRKEGSQQCDRYFELEPPLWGLGRALGTWGWFFRADSSGDGCDNCDLSFIHPGWIGMLAVLVRLLSAQPGIQESKEGWNWRNQTNERSKFNYSFEDEKLRHVQREHWTLRWNLWFGRWLGNCREGKNTILT